MVKEESLFDIFLYETTHLLDEMETKLLEAEKTKKADKEWIDNIFRIMHTIKGSSAMLDFKELSKLSHGLEDVYSLIRDNNIDIKLISKILDVSLEVVSFIKEELKTLDENGSLQKDIKPLLKKIDKIFKDIKDVKNKDIIKNIKEEITGKINYKINVKFKQGCMMEDIRSLDVKNKLGKISKVIKTNPNVLKGPEACKKIIENGASFFIDTNSSKKEIQNLLKKILFLEETLVSKYEEEVISLDMESVKNNSYDRKHYISVDVNKLDNLLNNVIELVTSRAILEDRVLKEFKKSEKLENAFYNLNERIKELQENIMDIRMVPIKKVFFSMKRLVRDMSKKENKKINLTFIGEETEVDKNIIEDLYNPIIHLIRNAIDHGIELAEERTKINKSSEGNITLKAKTEGGNIIVSICDDGKGLDKKAILNKAIDKGYIKKSVQEITEKELYSIIMKPGFSTVEEINEYSGRGVGMDVVYEEIKKLGGLVKIDSKENEGTTINLIIPLTLSIVNGIKVISNNISYIVPINAMKSIFKSKKEDIVEDTNGNTFVIIQEKNYPLINFNNYFGNEKKNEFSNKIIMLIEASEEEKFAVAFDEIQGEYQVVVKAFPKYLKKCTKSLTGLSGCATMGDGTISYIVDVTGLALELNKKVSE
ncbi:MAG: chemotaxis protein CheA [Fusobacterium sp. JB020]|nr:chemotaxis protein CheA [Fusobacterium sp. JB020]